MTDTDKNVWIECGAAAVRVPDHDMPTAWLTAMDERGEQHLRESLTALFVNIAKIQMLPDKVERGWRVSIFDRQQAIRRILKQAPVLLQRIDGIIQAVVPDALGIARAETGVGSDLVIVGSTLPYALRFDPWAAASG